MEHSITATKTILPAAFLEELVSELDEDRVLGIILGGSYARGNATTLSDLDLALFVRDEAEAKPRRYFYRRGLLVSVVTKSITGVRTDMANPRMATRVVPGISESRVLVDKDGSLAKLMHDLVQFTWAPLQESANRHVSYLMLMLTESIHKVANELVKGNDLGVAYTTDKLLAALTEAIAIQRGIMTQSDSTYYQQVQEAAGMHSEWTKYHRLAAGLTSASLDERAKACLYLYQLTMDLVRSALSEEHAQVAEEAIRRVAFVYA